MKKLLLTVKDRAQVNDLEMYGNILYKSDYTSLIGFECEEKDVAILKAHPNVLELEDACIGQLQY